MSELQKAVRRKHCLFADTDLGTLVGSGIELYQ